MRYAVWALVAVLMIGGCAPDAEGADYSPSVTDRMPIGLTGENFDYTMPNGDKVPCVLFSGQGKGPINVSCDWSRTFR